MVNFWATWCVPCIREIPSFNKLHKDFAGQGVAVLGIAMDEEGARARPALPQEAPDGLPRGPGQRSRSTQQYNLDLLPVTLVFDRAGKQVKRFEGFTPEADLLVRRQAGAVAIQVLIGVHLRSSAAYNLFLALLAFRPPQPS